MQMFVRYEMFPTVWNVIDGSPHVVHIVINVYSFSDEALLHKNSK